MMSLPDLSPRHPVDLPAWIKLREHLKKDRAALDIGRLFGADRQRFEAFSARSGDLVLDYSRQCLQRRTRKLLLSLARQAELGAWREAMFTGAAINTTEQRAVLHTALRAGRSGPAERSVYRDVRSVRDAMLRFVDAVHAGEITGSLGERFTDVVNIGIGGSDLGIVMAAEALDHVGTGLRLHAVSNVDGTQLADLTRSLNPATTLVVICSKTFTTLETMTNAHAARSWIRDALGEEAVAAHFAAASTNHPAMDAFDIAPDRRFGFWDWVGGRYSLWSAVGLSIALGVGSEAFRDVLRGGRTMDTHFREAPFEDNLPVLMAVLAIWNSNFLGAATHAILPYDHRLSRFPAYLQQLQMESNGKSVRRDGRKVTAETGAIIWGEPGSNAQHSFYQLLHQGTRRFSADFILPVRSSGATQAQQDLAIANCLAQADALAWGYSESDARAELVARGHTAASARALAKHKVHPGNHPNSVVLCKALTAQTLGQLIALYEHKVFVEGVILGINSFDQWGVELGKKMASELAPAVADADAASGASAPTRELLKIARRWRT